MSNELMLDQNYNKFELDIKNMSKEEIGIYVKEQANIITQKIQDCSNKIKKAEKSAEDANNIDTSWSLKNFFGGKTKEKVNKVSEALITTNEALAETQNLIQATIKYSKCSVFFARELNQAMAFIMVNGFQSTNGKVTHLTKESKEAVNIICGELEEFISTNQRRDSEIKKIQSNIRDYEQDLTKYGEITESNILAISKNQENIESNRQNISRNKEAIDTNRQSIDSNKEAIDTNRQSIDSNKELIKRNEQSIQNLSELILENSKTISKINEELLNGIKNVKFSSLAISIISLVVAIVGIGMHFAK